MTDISLLGKIPRSELVACVAAHWWTNNSPLVIVDFEECRSDKQFSLCLDLEKATFIDHAENSDIDDDVRSKTTDIVRAIIDLRFPPPQ